jgi:hypothetical protein
LQANCPHHIISLKISLHVCNVKKVQSEKNCPKSLQKLKFERNYFGPKGHFSTDLNNIFILIIATEVMMRCIDIPLVRASGEAT